MAQGSRKARFMYVLIIERARLPFVRSSFSTLRRTDTSARREALTPLPWPLFYLLLPYFEMVETHATTKHRMIAPERETGSFLTRFHASRNVCGLRGD